MGMTSVSNATLSYRVAHRKVALYICPHHKSFNQCRRGWKLKDLGAFFLAKRSHLHLSPLYTRAYRAYNAKDNGLIDPKWNNCTQHSSNIPSYSFMGGHLRVSRVWSSLNIGHAQSKISRGKNGTKQRRFPMWPLTNQRMLASQLAWGPLKESLDPWHC